MDWCIPVLGQFIVKAYKRNRAARHIQGSDIISHQVTCNSDLFGVQDAMQGIEHDVEFDQRRPPHTIDQCQDLITRFEAQVLDDGSGKHLGHLECRSELDAPTPRFAVYADADLHFVFAQLEVGLACCWHGTGSQSHTHTAPLLIHLSRQGRYLRSEEHTSELQSRQYLVCRLLLEKKKKKRTVALKCKHVTGMQSDVITVLS